MHHVILGNGVAGIEAALAIRARDDAARITLISAEHDHFYSRTALMYLLAGQLSLRDTEPYDRQLYERLRFERVRGRAERLEAGARKLTVDGRILEFDRLLLAVGSRARPAPWPGSRGPGVHAFVTLQDLDALEREVIPGRTACVIGGGLIGVEVAEALLHRGMKVRFLVREPWDFPVALDERESDVVAAHIRTHGVEVRTRTPVEAIERDGERVTGVRTPDGTVACDLVVVAIGVEPNTGFLRGSDVALADNLAIETEPDLSVRGHPHVFAAGDCANVTWADGVRRPEQLWYTARDQGRVAGAAMLGDAVRYQRGAWYNSAKFFDLEYTTAGWVPPDPTGWRTWYQQHPTLPVTQRIVCKGDRVVGFNAVGSRWDHTRILAWIREHRTLPWVLAHLEEARFDEELSPPFRVLPTATLTE